MGSGDPGFAICRDPSSKRQRWLVFERPERILSAETLSSVERVVDAAGKAALAGKWVVGFVSYEAAPAFDSAMEVFKQDGSFPLAWFGVYEQPAGEFKPSFSNASAGLDFTPEVAKETHCERLAEVARCIKRGDTYQIDLSLRLHDAAPKENAFQTFQRLAASHPTPFMAFLNTGSSSICSLSPELFLERRGDTIATEPMKGTARRASTLEDDTKIAAWLANDPKNRAENLMIVDMARNDLGRVCEIGSVKVPELFKVVTYPTVHQMISRVEGTLPESCGLLQLLQASFPPASITGAPKIMAMKKIAELESSPRRIYTGCLGCLAPGGDLLLNVAIRTILFDRKGAELGVGGGIVADSVASDEWEECLTKAAFATHRQEDFKLIETLLWRKDGGFQMLDQHRRRAESSQHALGRSWNEGNFANALASLKPDCAFARCRVLIDAQGEVEASWTKIETPSWGKDALKILLAKPRTDAFNALLRHKTTARKLYDFEFKAAHEAGFDETLFLNSDGEFTEGAISNAIFKRREGRLVTPALDCGLLPGLWRAGLEAEEEHLTLADLADIQEISFGNSVRGGCKAFEVWEREADGFKLIWRQP